MVKQLFNILKENEKWNIRPQIQKVIDSLTSEKCVLSISCYPTIKNNGVELVFAENFKYCYMWVDHYRLELSADEQRILGTKAKDLFGKDESKMERTSQLLKKIQEKEL